FVEVDQLRDRADIGPVSDPEFLLRFVEDRTRKIVPSEFQNKSIPDHEVAFVETPPVGETPIQDLLVRAPLEHSLPQDAVIYPEKICAGAVRRLRPAEVGVIILRQLAAAVEPDLVQ